MKIRCPKCKNEIELGVSKFPPTGIEVNCPSCGAKFRLKSKGKAAQEAADTPADTPPAPAADAAIAPPPPAEAPAAPIAAPPPAAPAPEDDLDGLDDLADLFDEIEQLSADEPAAPTYFVRGQSGKVFGPLADDAIIKMLQAGQLQGDESVSTDQQSWSPMGEWDAFRAYAKEPQLDTPAAAPVTQDNVEWDDAPLADPEPPRPAARPAPPSMARAATPSESAPRAAASSSAAARAAAAPPSAAARAAFDAASATPIDTPEGFSEPPPSASKPAQRRIRSALKDEVLEGEENPQGVNWKDPKILAGGGVIIALLLAIVGVFAFSGSGPKKIDYKNVRVNFRKPYAIDSYRAYTRGVLSKLDRALRGAPGHPQLTLYQALALSMYLEHYSPDTSRKRKLARVIKSMPKESRNKSPFHYQWLLAQAAILKKQPAKVTLASRKMLGIRKNHVGALYLQGKAHLLARRYKRAVAVFDQVIKSMSEPSRAYYAKGLALEKQGIRLPRRKPRPKPAKKGQKPAKKGQKPAKKGKKPAKNKQPAKKSQEPAKKAPASKQKPIIDKALLEEAFESFYKATLVTRDHMPSYLAMIRLGEYLPEKASKVTKAWKSAAAQITAISNRQLKASFYTLRYRHFKKQNEPQKALLALLSAERFATKKKQIQRMLPQAYLDTYDYAKIWEFIKKQMKQKRKPGSRRRKPSFKEGPSVVFLEVIFRLQKWDVARPWLKPLNKYCKKCKGSYRYWYWIGRLQEALRNYGQAKGAYARSLSLNPGAMCAIAGQGRIALIRSNDDLAKKKLARLEKANITGNINRISAIEFYHKNKSFEKVKELALSGLKEHPADEFFNRYAGEGYLAEKAYKKAKEHYERALKVRSSDGISIRGLGIAEENLDNLKGALILYKKYLKFDKRDPDVLYRTGRVYYLLKDFKQAIVFLKRSIEYNEKIADAHYYLGRAFEAQQGKSGAAYKIREAYERAIQLDPTNRIYLYRLARYYYKNRQFQKALSIYTKLLRAKQTKKQKAEVYLERGKLLFEERSWRKALSDFKRVYRMEKTTPGIEVWIGDVYREQRSLSQAAAWYKKAIKRKESNAPNKKDPAEAKLYEKYKLALSKLYGYLGDIYRERRSSSRAIRAYRKATKLNPKGYSYHRHLGYLYKDRKFWRPCRLHLRAYLKYAPKTQLVDRREVENDMRGCR